MLRFNHQNDGSLAKSRLRKAAARKQRRQIWMLLAALGLVILAMRHLNQPETAHRLGQLFGAAELSQQAPSEAALLQLENVPNADAVDILPADTVAGETVEDSSNAHTTAARENSNQLAAIRDNTYFRPAESDAWFGLFGKLIETTNAQLSAQSLGELTYAQLLKQPEVYRGKPVTIRGTVRREEVQQAPENSLGLSTYHRLWIEPKGGTTWPIVVYCLELPQAFPRGDGLNANVTVTGFFFKNWSYPWRDGLGIAPVVLARDVEILTTAQPPMNARPSHRSVSQALVAACCFAAVVVYVVMRSTQRTRLTMVASGSPGLPAGDVESQQIHDHLRMLAESESNG